MLAPHPHYNQRAATDRRRQCSVGQGMEGKQVLFRCDNAAVVAIVNSGRSKHPLAMHYTRLLYLLGAVFNFSFKSVHIAGRDNVAADGISRNNSSLFLQITPAAERFPIPIPAEVKTAICQIAPRKLETTAEFYFSKGIADSTRKSYLSARNRYIKFCKNTSLITLPLTENKLCLFVSHIADSGLKYQTIKCYLSGLRYFQISAGIGDPFNNKSMPRLEYITKGIKKAESENPSTRAIVRMPITPEILQMLKKGMGIPSYYRGHYYDLGRLYIGIFWLPKDRGNDCS